MFYENICAYFEKLLEILSIPCTRHLFFIYIKIMSLKKDYLFNVKKMSGEEPNVETGQRNLAVLSDKMSMKGEVIACGSASDGSSTEGQIEESTKASSHRNSSHNVDVPSLYYENLLCYLMTDAVKLTLVYKLSLEKDSAPHENIRQVFEVNSKDEDLELEHVNEFEVYFPVKHFDELS
ncbi:uncharacterized protein LOC143236859 [Tachypleus tridentatus]|uniref:uncharacterized protein LOC143236859 n=1 Tax=Tachypleus tridentatus TaxID=6853 RepID=UPI003FCF4FF7